MPFGIAILHRVSFSEYSSGDLEINVLGDHVKWRDQMSTALRSRPLRLYNKKAGMSVSMVSLRNGIQPDKLSWERG